MQALRGRFLQRLVMLEMQQRLSLFYDCLLYTSDAADD